MKLLTGEFKNMLDEKGRLSLPARLRSDLPSSLVLTQGVDTCLWLFAPEEWEELSQRILASTSLFQARSRLIQRRIIAPAQEVEVDKLGRISIPQSLRDWAGLSKECIILGISRYVEIWDSQRYQAYLAENQSEFLSAAEELGGLTLS
ncbi:MAG: division/cell wall cluster transcriptional repressor MraZ [Spirochaetia bacterium]|jgi:MraZ protein|uniref:Transcriptional regulator MraZ n=1 Tax=uncultured spirochete TaxID=156406 RepID=A0A3P3XGL6_9SPIR|nr:division/cell wall cluster transcriptional repressor MraZ [Rectinema subterraneum]MDQ7795198.1 division/cell wall cluster transcriptional repressor MraZ [Spirochaetia bacterium]SLM10363.1 Protein MraZ [uncultured spirochete]